MSEKPTIIITGSQHDRTWELDYNIIPTQEQFIDIVKTAPRKTLIGMGFCFWETINNVIADNAARPKHDIISIPAFDIEMNPLQEPMTFDVGHKDNPTEPVAQDMDIMLIPAEWYNSIPEGYELYSITGSKELFKKGETDDDRRFGCLAYGILIPSDINTA